MFFKYLFNEYQKNILDYILLKSEIGVIDNFILPTAMLQPRWHYL